MKISKYSDLSAGQRKALFEISISGARNALGSLGMLINRPVELTDVQADIFRWMDLLDVFGGPERRYISILLNMHGDLVNGSFLFLLELEQAAELVNEVFGDMNMGASEEMDAMKQSFLCEMGNILANAYVNTLAEQVDQSVETSTPEFCLDMIGAILGEASLEYMDAEECVLRLENRYACPQAKFSLHVLFFPSINSLLNLCHV